MKTVRGHSRIIVISMRWNNVPERRNCPTDRVPEERGTEDDRYTGPGLCNCRNVLPYKPKLNLFSLD